MKATIFVFPDMPKTVEDKSRPRKKFVKGGVLNALPGACPEIIRERVRARGPL